MQMRNNTSLQYDKAAALASSRHATKYLGMESKRYFEFKKNHALTIYFEQNLLVPRMH